MEKGSSGEDWKVALDQFVEEVRKGYDGRLQQVVLYGSRARGTADEGSDVDVLVVLNPLGDFWEESSRLNALAGPIALAHDVVLSAIAVDAEEFARPRTPLMLTARREGIRVA